MKRNLFWLAMIIIAFALLWPTTRINKISVVQEQEVVVTQSVATNTQEVVQTTPAEISPESTSPVVTESTEENIATVKVSFKLGSGPRPINSVKKVTYVANKQ